MHQLVLNKQLSVQQFFITIEINSIHVIVYLFWIQRRSNEIHVKVSSGLISESALWQYVV